jgi:alanyl-tRNA synthetase
MMLFGEKYPDVVRVVSMGDYSKELCGGTHLANTAETGLFKIIGEESIAKGIRRITALTGLAAVQRVQRDESLLRRIAMTIRAAAEDLPERVEALAKQVRELQKKASAAPKAEGVGVDQLLAGAVEVQGVKIIAADVPGGTPQSLRDLIDQLRRKAAPVAVLLGTKQEEGKVMLIAGLSRDLVDRGLDSVQWIREAAALVGGKGGGRADMAQAGGSWRRSWAKPSNWAARSWRSGWRRDPRSHAPHALVPTRPRSHALRGNALDGRSAAPNGAATGCA